MANQLNSDLAAGLTNTICKDGQSTPTANIKMGNFKITGLGNGTASTDAAAYGQIIFPIGLIGGLALSTAGSSGTFGVASGSATDSTNVSYLTLASAFTKTTASWASGTGNGGLDTSSIANSTWYHAFLIGGGSNAVDVLFSLSPSSPTLPGTYTTFRRLGSMKTDSSAHWVAFFQNGNSFMWNSSIQDLTNVSIPNGSIGSFAMASVPSGVLVQPIITIEASNASGGSYNVNNGGSTGVGARAGLFATSASFDVIISSFTTNATQQLTWFSTAGATATVITAGWVDRRGQG